MSLKRKMIKGVEHVYNALDNGNTIHYKIVNGTAYNNDTPDEVVKILESAIMDEDTRIRVCLGDSKTGRDWDEHYGVCGYIGRSTGEIKIPLMIPNSRSTGGPGLLDHCIVRIEKKFSDRKYYQVYQHPKYHK